MHPETYITLVKQVPQPARFMVFISGLGITLYMSAVVIHHNM